ncbi:MAG: FAD-dependent oxidoreductase [Deltaproteobacteria bacterium]|nr:FAD-dependent oxidoreductase [Deltaproteobacteria bacterium]
MTNYEEPVSENTIEWPYPIDYEKENEISADVLILGGGIAGCHAAINAAKRGAKVVVVEKGAVIRSGAGGAGVDHWHAACTNPCSKVTPEEMMEAVEAFGDYYYGEYGNGITCYILCRESYDTLLDLEKMGVKIRDEDDDFKGAEFRDEETKLMFAYDYENRHNIRVQGAEIKPALYKELKRLGVEIHDRVMTTSLLTEGGKQGARVVGATGFNVRTGEFYVFKAKSTIISMGRPSGLWAFSTELIGAQGLEEPNWTGDGSAMAWNAGAECALMERSGPSSGGFRYPSYGAGNCGNTWYACNMVDANGKEIPWVDRDGRLLKNISERYYPSTGQRLTLYGPNIPYELRGASLVPDLAERIRKGEFTLPLYADLPSMPVHERRAIFGLMVAHEGKTRIPIYENYTQAGFDPDKDMLQTPIAPPERAHMGGMGMGAPQWRELAFCSGGGPVINWDLRTTLEGLYAAGNQSGAGSNHGAAAATGRYSARKAAAYAKSAKEPVIDRNQVDQEKLRVYAPVKRKDGGGWKELQAGLCRIMQDYCGEHKSEAILNTGLEWLKSISESEASNTVARNPHELMRTVECFSRITSSEMVMHACLARKASSRPLNFNRLDYPEVDPPEWNKLVTTRLDNGAVVEGEMPIKYWLSAPYAPTYKENYEEHSEP